MLRFFILLILPITVSAGELRAWPAPDCTAEPQFKESKDLNALGSKVSDANLTVLGINVPKNKMKEIGEPLPSALIANDEKGCASCSDYACYLSTDKSVALIFYRYTSWDLHGFEILKVSNHKLPKQCQQTNLNSSSFKTDSGIAIGVSKEYVADKIKVDNAQGELIFHHGIKMSQSQIESSMLGSRGRVAPKCSDYYWDAFTSVVLEYDDEGLTRFFINYTESF
ncbi:MAG: hypothetical protein V7785_13400 [Bermanella sp.]